MAKKMFFSTQDFPEFSHQTKYGDAIDFINKCVEEDLEPPFPTIQVGIPWNNENEESKAITLAQFRITSPGGSQYVLSCMEMKADGYRFFTQPTRQWLIKNKHRSLSKTALFNLRTDLLPWFEHVLDKNIPLQQFMIRSESDWTDRMLGTAEFAKAQKTFWNIVHKGNFIPKTELNPWLWGTIIPETIFEQKKPLRVLVSGHSKPELVQDILNLLRDGLVKVVGDDSPCGKEANNWRVAFLPQQDNLSPHSIDLIINLGYSYQDQYLNTRKERLVILQGKGHIFAPTVKINRETIAQYITS